MGTPVDPSDPLLHCAAEPIHRLGRVQSHGVVLVCEGEGDVIRAVSANSAERLGLAPDALLGRPLAGLEPTLGLLAERAAARPTWPDGTPFRAKTVLPAEAFGGRFEAAVHRWQGGAIVELQPLLPFAPAGDVDPAVLVDTLSHRLGLAGDVVELCGIACEEIQRITGYRRVMAYAFDDDWNGEVIAEHPRPGEPVAFLGLHFPASDIPPQARELYRTVHLRVIADAHDEGTPLVGPGGGVETPDLSHALLRSVSPMHLQYLRNMGVRATIAISLLVDGRLWGLVVAHDDQPRVPPQHVVHALRLACRIMGQLASARLLALEYRQRLVEDHALMNLIERLQVVANRERDVVGAWSAMRDDLLGWFQADGAALLHEGVLIDGCGAPPGLLEACIACWGTRPGFEPIATASLAGEGLAEPGAPIAGLLWIPVVPPGHGLLLWRKESPREIVWGGDPDKALSGTVRDGTLGPRRSFAAWQETRRDLSLPWTSLQREGARRIGSQWRLLVLDEERRRAEDTIALLETGIMRIHDGFMIARATGDAGLEVVVSNPLFDRLLHGARPSVGEVPGFLDPGVVEAAACDAIRRELALGRAADLELMARDGRWLALSLTPVQGPSGAPSHWAAILRDVSGRKAEERQRLAQSRALQDANERYARILEASHDGIMTLDDRRLVDYCNPRMLEILGEVGDLASRPFRALFADPSQAEAMFSSRATTRVASRREAVLLDASGRELACDIALVPMRGAGPGRDGWLVMVSDLSERKELEHTLLRLNAGLEATIAERTAELVSAKESADAANRAKGEFLANMSHELRSPLHGILGFTRLLIDDAGLPPERQASYLGKIDRNASNLLVLVNDLLDSAKIEARSFSLQPVRCDLVEIARGVAGEFQGEVGASSPIRLLLPPVAPCNGDPVRLSQVVRNLVANAIRFSPPGSKVEVVIERDGRGWALAVRDRGPGIPVDELETIFERFTQSSGTKTGAGGTGLGLQIARGIIDSHGGWLRAANREGGGAVFRAFLPDPA